MFFCQGLPPFFFKVLIDLLQKVADSKGGAFGRAPQGAKRSYGVSFLLSFFLCACGVKEKSGLTEPIIFTEEEPILSAFSFHHFACGKIVSPPPFFSKVLIDLLQKDADSKGGAFGRAPQSAKFPLHRFSFWFFFSCGLLSQEKKNRHT